MTERWLPVPDYEDIYEVSDAGNVRRAVDSGVRWKAGDPVKPARIKNGRMVVRLHRAGVRSSRYVHRLVALAHLGTPAPGLEVCHADSDPTNNHVSNLRWDTHVNNMREMVEQGRRRNGNEAKTHCPSGHEYTEANTRVSADGRHRACRSCHKAWAQERRNKEAGKK